jgi:hypothetical protein
VRFSDLTDEGAQAESVKRLKELGVDRLLRRAGAQDGDVVHVGTTSFEWYREGTDMGLEQTDSHRRSAAERLARREKKKKRDA